MAEQAIITFAEYVKIHKRARILLLTCAPNSDLGSEIVDLCVGKEGKRYTVHKDQLFSGSKYFAFLRRQPGMNGNNATIDMRDEDTGAVSLLISFIYRRSIPTFDGHQCDMKARESAKSGFQNVSGTSSFPKSTGPSIFQKPQPALTPVKADSGTTSLFPKSSPLLGSFATPTNVSRYNLKLLAKFN